MDGDTVTLRQLRSALTQRDASLIGRAYAADLRRRLDMPGTAAGRRGEGRVGDWLMIVWDGTDRDSGEEIGAELWLDLVIAAADELRDSHAVWCIGDGPADHLVGVHPKMGARLHQARATHPGVEAMFQAMLEDYRSMGYPHAGWWSDPAVLER